MPLIVKMELSKEDELHGIVQAIVSVILDDETLPTWSIGSSLYYTKLARHLCEHDDELVKDITHLTSTLRGRYRSFLEHSHLVSLVNYTKDPVVSTRCNDDDDDVCCVCLQACDATTWQRTVRLRSHDGDPRKCGHRLHKTCALRLYPNEDGVLHCPLCRESLGPYVRSWVDEESKVPRF